MIVDKFKDRQIWDSIKKNGGLIYSLFLVFLIPIILFFAIYYNLIQFEKVFNYQLQKEANLINNVVSVVVAEESSDLGKVQSRIEKIREESPEIVMIRVLMEQDGEYMIVASSDPAEVGNESKDFKNYLASGLTTGIASIESDGEERLWDVAGSIKGSEGKNLVIRTKLSLKEIDQAFNASVRSAYWILVLTSLVIILLVTHYIRLFKYVFLFNKIKEVDRMKDDFISMASHELKTPLVAIKGFVDLLSDSSKEKLTDEERSYLKKIDISSKRLKVLVDDLLEVSKIEQNRIPLKIEPVSAVKVVQKVIDTLAVQAANKKLKLGLENALGKGEDIVSVDASRLEQVLVNLVGNSIKYTLKGGIKVKIFEKKKKIFISVKDTGIGMNADQQDKMFSKFYRAKAKSTRQAEGTGLGLWITQQLVEKMDGKIDVESMEGMGSKFIVSFKKVSLKK